MKCNINRYFKILFVITMLLVVSIAGAMGVQPLIIEMHPKPGDTVPFSISLISTENISEQVKISLVKPSQLATGELSFKGADPTVFPELQWVKLNSESALVMPGEKVEVTGTVKVPLNAKGSHSVIVMLEPLTAKKMGSLELRVRYAARLDIEVDTPGLRPTVQVSDFEMVKGEKGEPVIKVKAENTSLLDFLTTANVTIRDNRNKKLIERVELRPQIGWQHDSSEMRMMHGCTLDYYGTPKEALTPGEYDLRLFYRFGNSGQILLSKTVNIKEGDFVYSAGKLRRVKITPEEVVFSGNPGTSSTKGIKFENRFNIPIKVVLQTQEIAMDYPFSLIKKTTIEFKNNQEFTLEPGRMAVSIMGVNFPKDASAQGYYGLLKVTVLSNDQTPAMLEEYLINLEAIVPGKHQISAELTGLSGDNDHQKYLLSAVVKNTGNIKISPYAELVLKDKDDKLVAATKLVVEGIGVSSVIPTKLITLTGSVDSLKSGLYKAELKFFEGTVELGISKSNLQVK